MAIRGYEVRLIWSAQNHTGSAFRAVMRDLKAIDTLQQKVNSHRLTLTTNARDLERAKKAAESEIVSRMRGGKIYERLQRDRGKLLAEEIALNNKLTRSLERQNAVRENLTATRGTLQKVSNRRADLLAQRANAEAALHNARNPVMDRVAQDRARRDLRDALRTYNVVKRFNPSDEERKILDTRARKLTTGVRERDLERAVNATEDPVKQARLGQLLAAAQASHASANIAAKDAAAGRQKSTSLTSALRAQKAVERAQKSLRKITDAGVIDPAKVARAEQALAKYDRQLQNNDLDYDKARRAVNKLDRQLAELGDVEASTRSKIAANAAALQVHSGRMGENAAMTLRAAEAAKLYGVEQAAVAAQLQRLAAAEARVGAIQRQRAKWQMTGHVSSAMRMQGGIGLGIAAGAANTYAEFSKQAKLASTQTPGQASGKQLVADSGRLQTAILENMKTFAFGATDYAKAAYDIFSSIQLPEKGGFEQGLQYLKLASVAGVAGLTDIGTATHTTTLLANQFGNSIGELASNLDTAFGIIKYGKMDFAGFDQMLERVGPAANAANMSLQDIGGLMAFLSRRSGSPSKAGTVITRLLQTLQNQDFVKGAGVMGFPIESNGRLGSKLTQQGKGNVIDYVVAQIRKGGFKDPGIALTNAIQYITSVGRGGLQGGKQGDRSTQFARQGFTQAVLGSEELKKDNRHIRNGHGQLMEQFNAIQNDPGYKWTLTLNQFKVAWIQVGQVVLPMMTKLAAYLVAITKRFSDWASAHKSLAAAILVGIPAFLLLAGAIIPLVATVARLVLLFKLFRAINVVKGLVGVTSAATGAAGAVATLRVLLGRLIAMSGIVVGITILRNIIDKNSNTRKYTDQDLKHHKWTGGILAFGDMAAGAVDSLTGTHINDWSHHAKMRADVIGKFKRDQIRVLTDAVKRKLKPGELAEYKTSFDYYKKDLEKRLGTDIPDFDFARVLAAVKSGKYNKKTGELGVALKKKQMSIGDEVAKMLAEGKKAAAQKLLQSQKSAPGAKALYEALLKQFSDPDVGKISKSQAARDAQHIRDAVKQATDEAKQNFKSAVDMLTSTYNQFKSENMSIHGAIGGGDILSGWIGDLYRQFNVAPSVRAMTADITKQNQDMAKYNHAVEGLRKKGVSKDLIDELRNLGPEGAKMIRRLNEASKPELDKYIKQWKIGHKQIKAATQGDMDTQLAEWKSFGKKVAEQIMLGMENPDQKVARSFKKLLRTWYPGIEKFGVAAAITKAKQENAANDFDTFFTQNQDALKRIVTTPIAKRTAADKKMWAGATALYKAYSKTPLVAAQDDSYAAFGAMLKTKGFSDKPNAMPFKLSGKVGKMMTGGAHLGTVVLNGAHAKEVEVRTPRGGVLNRGSIFDPGGDNLKDIKRGLQTHHHQYNVTVTGNGERELERATKRAVESAHDKAKRAFLGAGW